MKTLSLLVPLSGHFRVSLSLLGLSLLEVCLYILNYFGPLLVPEVLALYFILLLYQFGSLIFLGVPVVVLRTQHEIIR